MPPRLQPDTAPVLPELQAITEAASRRLKARAAPSVQDGEAAERALVEAASAAVAARCSLAAIADAERRGEQQARAQLRPDALKRVERSDRRAREAAREYEHAIVQAAHLGLSTREVAAAAGITHATVRALIARLDREPAPNADLGAAPAIDAPDADRIQQTAEAA